MFVIAKVQNELGPFTIADWNALPARENGSRLELIEGNWLVTPPPSGQHQWAEKRLIRVLDNAIDQGMHADLYVVGGVGVEVNTSHRTALIPDIIVLDTPPVGTSFFPEHVVLAGEIWSPGNTFSEQREKFEAFAEARVPYFWSITQDHRGPVELVAYRLRDGCYTCENTVKLGGGSSRVTASPVEVDIDIAALRA